ncbi:MAG: hypothetical protein HY552_05095 [Elusimicrobia bacterium]|nr:hypothetical protein [Elusimicrobiota bacterium]
MSGEGELLLGNDSATAYKEKTVEDEKGNTKVVKQLINPWKFSADKGRAEEIQALAGQYVFIRYRQHNLKNPLAADTDYEFQEISPVNPEFAPKEACQIDMKGGNSKGFRMARIVKASRKGVAVKSFELMLQVGGAGNQFEEMSVSDEGIYKCAQDWLASGKAVNVWYAQSYIYNPITQGTGYSVWKLEPLASLN